MFGMPFDLVRAACEGIIRCDKHGLNFASADIARIRLLDVVARDRAAVPCGRWKPRVKGEFYPGRKGHLPFKVKPRWRYEVRR